ncbi:hypothetical protein [Corynebacterium sp.]|uniref:hypothetical protein n=1 Tax=Corynebacterium sp. TaxID=1720 RepID=UPI002586EE67|nr:hypothetical protein [Corynebacterium sp.]
MNLTAHSPRLRRRISALVFAGLLPLALASCSDDNGDATEVIAEDSTTSTASSEARKQEDPEASKTTESTEESSESKKRKPNPTLGSSAPDQDAGKPSLPSKQPKKQAKGECIWPTVEEAVSKPGENLVSTYCDGTWAVVGQYQTDGVGLSHYNGREWEGVDPDSLYGTGAGPCYSESLLRELGVPDAAIAKAPACNNY